MLTLAFKEYHRDYTRLTFKQESEYYIGWAEFIDGQNLAGLTYLINKDKPKSTQTFNSTTSAKTIFDLWNYYRINYPDGTVSRNGIVGHG